MQKLLLIDFVSGDIVLNREACIARYTRTVYLTVYLVQHAYIRTV